jgi:ABC-type antimicrobial peptide transport system permease subunit
MGMQVLAGRDFRIDSPEDSASILVNESMAKLVSPKNPADAVGQVIQRDDQNLVVVGVLRNFVYNNMYGSAEPVIFFNDQEAQYTSVLNIRLKPTRDLGASLASVKAALEKHNPNVPVEWRFADEEFDKLFQSENLMGMLAALFAGLAIFISCLGLFGLAAYMAERRIREIGIRKVLGTSVMGVVRLLSVDFIRIVLLACLIAFPLAWWLMDSWLQEFGYRITISWWMFLLPALLALFIALLTVSSQALRAALMNPIKALRTE